MSDQVAPPIRFAIAHCFTTRRNPDKGALLQVVCKRYHHDRAPQIKDWIVNPGLGITRRVYERSGISTQQAQQKPSFEEIHSDILQFLENLDVLFICDLDEEAKWFKTAILHGASPPVLVDLVEKFKYFLPERQTPYSDLRVISLAENKKGESKIYQILRGMTIMLDDILQSILIRAEVEDDPYNYPVYSLLHWALSSAPIDKTFYSILAVASQAYKVQWESGQIAEIAYDVPKLMSRDQLQSFVNKWQPSDLIEKGRKTYDESVLMGDEKNQSAKGALQVLKCLAASDDEADTSKRLREYTQKVEGLLREFEVHLFKFSCLLMKAIHHNDEIIQEEIANDCKTTAIEITVCLRKIIDLSAIRSNELPDKYIQVIQEKSESLRNDFKKRHEKIPEWIEASPSDQNAFNSLKREMRLIHELGKDFHLRTTSIQDEFFERSIDLLSDSKQFEERPQQKKYAGYIKDSINIGGTYAVEAGTGTGKTLGYLIPVCEHVRVNKNRQIIVATATNNLTDQVVTKEWKTITTPRNSLYQDLKIAVLKGKNNYLCVTAILDIFKEFNREISFKIKKNSWMHRQKLEVNMMDTFVPSHISPMVVNHAIKQGNQLIGESALTVVSDGHKKQQCESNGLFIFKDEDGQDLDCLKIQRGQTASYYVQLHAEPEKDVAVTIFSQSAGVTINLPNPHGASHQSIDQDSKRLAWLYLFLTLSRKDGRWDSHAEFYRKYEYVAKEYPVDAESQCKSEVCRRGNACPYPQALMKARNADLVITNHHKLAMLDDDIQKRATVCIIDEADQFPDNLRSALTQSLESKDITDFIRRVVGTQKRRGFVQVFRENLESANPYENHLQEIENTCHKVQENMRKMTIVNSKKGERRWKDLSDHNQSIIVEALNGMAEAFEIIVSNFERIPQCQPSHQKIRPDRIKRLLAYRDEAKTLRDKITQIIAVVQCEQHFVTYTQKKYQWHLNQIPFNIGAHVNGLTNHYQSVIFTSATIYVDGGTELFELELLGDEAKDPAFTGTLKIDSPFAFDKQVDAAVTRFIPKYVYGGDQEFNRKVLETITLLSVAIDGRSLVLFQSWDQMKQMYHKIYPILDEYEIPLLIQDQSGSSEAVIEAFADMEQSVLFGTNRFWTGADFPGKTLSQLIIVQIPNKPLSRAIVKERKDRWNADHRFWGIWYSGNTQRSLRQGFGRLIRRKDDRGLFILLDDRIINDQRMQGYQKAIPVQLKSEFPTAVELAHWCVKSLGLTPELEQREIDLETVYHNISRQLGQSNHPMKYRSEA